MKIMNFHFASRHFETLRFEILHFDIFGDISLPARYGCFVSHNEDGSIGYVKPAPANHSYAGWCSRP